MFEVAGGCPKARPRSSHRKGESVHNTANRENHACRTHVVSCAQMKSAGSMQNGHKALGLSRGPMPEAGIRPTSASPPMTAETTATAPSFTEVDGTPIATRHQPGSNPGLVWLGGVGGERRRRGGRAREVDRERRASPSED